MYAELAEIHPFRRMKETPIEELRRRVDASGGDKTPYLPVVEDLIAPGSAGGIRVRLYAPSKSRRLPAVLWVHGGGWTFGSLDGTDRTCRRLAADTGCAVVSLDYRKAPEHRFPAAIEDVIAAADWTVENAASLGLDASRLAIAGISSGADLAAAACLRARDRGSPIYALQLLVAPILDDDLGRPSMVADADPTLALADVAHVIEQYLGHPPPANNPLAFPSASASLAGLPPACIITAEFEPMRDGSVAYGERLQREARPKTTVHVIEGVGHSFFGLPAPAGEAAFALAVDAIRDALGPFEVEARPPDGLPPPASRLND